MARQDPILSAEVLLMPQSGKAPEDAAITAANARALAPDKQALEEAKGFLAKAGFEIGPHGGAGFSISAPKSVFERFFAAKIDVGTDGSARVKGAGKAATSELSLSKFPAALGRVIRAITFGRAPDYGPGSY